MMGIDTGIKNWAASLARVDPRDIVHGFEIIDWTCVQNPSLYLANMTPEAICDISLAQFSWMKNAWDKHVGTKQRPLAAMEFPGQMRKGVMGNLWQVQFLLDGWTKGNCLRAVPANHYKHLRQHVGIDLQMREKRDSTRSTKTEAMKIVDRLVMTHRRKIDHPIKPTHLWKTLKENEDAYNHVADSCSVIIYAAHIYQYEYGAKWSHLERKKGTLPKPAKRRRRKRV